MGKWITKRKRYHLLVSIAAIIFGVVMFYGDGVAKQTTIPEPTGLSLLGKYVFWDKISEPTHSMGCVTCHNPQVGWQLKKSETNLGQVGVTGANRHVNGFLKPPSAAYATFMDNFESCAGQPGCPFPSLLRGGNFWNGRSEGNEFDDLFPGGTATFHIGDEIFWTSEGAPLPIDAALIAEYGVNKGPSADQALNPMPNPVEQNIERKAVCEHVKSSAYAPLYEEVWGVAIDCSDTTPVSVQAPDVTFAGGQEYPFDISFKRLILAVAAYEADPEFNSFTSKRDIELAKDPDGFPRFPLAGFTEIENWGHDLFYGITSDLNPEGKNALCAGCHQSGNPALLGEDPQELYTDGGYHHTGFPFNSEIPVPEGVDSEALLADHTGNPIHRGLCKTPTLRNVGKVVDEDFVKAYGHNGWFKSLESIVHFYNTAFLGGPVPFPPFVIPYEATTAAQFGITRCEDAEGNPEIVTEAEALARNCWPAPAVNSPLTAIPFVVGDLHLTVAEEAAIVAYLRTLSDTYTPKAPKPFQAKKGKK